MIGFTITPTGSVRAIHDKDDQATGLTAGTLKKICTDIIGMSAEDAEKIDKDLEAESNFSITTQSKYRDIAVATTGSTIDSDKLGKIVVKLLKENERRYNNSTRTGDEFVKDTFIQRLVTSELAAIGNSQDIIRTGIIPALKSTAATNIEAAKLFNDFIKSLNIKKSEYDEIIQSLISQTRLKMENINKIIRLVKREDERAINSLKIQIAKEKVKKETGSLYGYGEYVSKVSKNDIAEFVEGLIKIIENCNQSIDYLEGLKSTD
jgi:hypothetical protein